MRKLPTIAICLSGAIAAAAAGCGSSSSNKAASTPQINVPRAKTAGASYHPKIDPSQFTADIRTKWWPIKQGATWVYDGQKDGVPEHVVVRVKPAQKTIMGVKTMTIQDTVTINKALEENTTDWYAQNKKTGDLWYFGEDSKDYKNGVVVSTQGTWEAGVDGAQPGVVFPGHAKAGGPTYRQEYRPGVAEDMARVLSISDTQTVPAGTFKGVLHTYDTDPLNPDKVENKFYAPGVGIVHVKRIGSAHSEEIKLITYTHP
jgi:hypothetical protein